MRVNEREREREREREKRKDNRHKCVSELLRSSIGRELCESADQSSLMAPFSNSHIQCFGQTEPKGLLNGYG